MKWNHSQYLLGAARTFVIALGIIALPGCQPAEKSSPEKVAEKPTTPEPKPAKEPEVETKRVVLFQYADSPLHQEGVRGVLEGLKAKGFVEGENLELTLHDAKHNLETTETIAQEIGNGDFDLIVTTGTQTLQAVAKANEAGKTPHVFGLVASPSRSDVGIGNEASGYSHPGHLVGVGSAPPVDPVFQIAKELYPDLKVVGVVWNSGEVNSQDGVERARKVASELGIELLEANATSTDEVGTQAKELVEKGAEALWIGPDNTTHHAADAVVAAAKEGGIPVISSMPGDAQRGALIDLTHNWQEVGKSVGIMAGDVLKGQDPAAIDITIHDDDELMLILNESALQGLKAPWKFPPDVVKAADKVIK